MHNALRDLKNSSPALSDMRDSDFDLLDEGEIRALAGLVSKMRRTAVHGTGSNWVRGEPGDSPYKTDVLVNNQGPQFGGNTRNDFPSAGDLRISETPDDEKKDRGSAVDGDFDENHKNDRIKELLEDHDDPYVVRFSFPEGEVGTDELAKEMFGEDAMSDGKSIYVVVNGYNRAIRIQSTVPGSTVETKGE